MIAQPSRPSVFRARSVLSPAFVLSASLLLTASAAVAQPIVIDFEQIPGMSNSPGSPIQVQSRLADQYLASHGVRFSSGSPFVAVVVHGSGTPSGVQIIGGSTPTGLLTYQNAFPIVVQFLDSTGTQPYVVSQVSIRGDLIPIPGTKTLEAYDVNGQLIATLTHPDSDPAPLLIIAPGIHSVRMYSSSATVGFDDLRFDTPTPAAGCPADFNQDGGIDGADVQAFFAAWENGDLSADVNADGGVDGSDVDSFFASWEAGVC